MNLSALVRPAPPPGPYLVVGMARSGVAALRALRARGEQAVGVDAGDPPVAELDGVVLGVDGMEQLDAGVRAVVKSPGVPREAAVIAEALRRELPVLGELELGWRLLDSNPFIAVTGTNGKTTTTELLGAIHREAGLAHAVAGNVGTAISALALPSGAVVIAEASSFQLEDTLAFAPDAAILLNLGADHQDRHGTLEAYHDAKRQAFVRQGPEAIAVSALEVPGAARRVAPLRIAEGALHDEHGSMAVRLRGPHNLDNAAAAAACALALGVPREAIVAALASFAGVAHRLEEVAERHGVLYVNDSKATNVGATLVALRAFDGRRVHVILGGRGKGENYIPLADALGGPAYLIGEEADAIAAVLDDELVVRCATLERAVTAARAAAAPGDVVLLSPACASYDQFVRFEERGDRFRELVSVG